MDKERIVSDSQRRTTTRGERRRHRVDSRSIPRARATERGTGRRLRKYLLDTYTHGHKHIRKGGMAAASSSSSSSSIMASSVRRSARGARHGRRAGNALSGGKAASMARGRRALVARAAKEFTVELEKPLGMKLGQKPGKVRENCCWQWPDGLLPSRPSSDE